jgi:hypothetical protein
MNRGDFPGVIPSGAALAGLGSAFTLGEPAGGQGVAAGAGSFELDEITIDELQRAMQTGRYTARRITELKPRSDRRPESPRPRAARRDRHEPRCAANR